MNPVKMIGNGKPMRVPKRCRRCVFLDEHSGYPYCPFYECERDFILRIPGKNKTVVLA